MHIVRVYVHVHACTRLIYAFENINFKELLEVFDRVFDEERLISRS
jgi:hypothetical protein